MIVWTGWGFLALIIGAVGGAGGTGIGVALGGRTDGPNVGTAVGLMLAGVVIWFVGSKLNAPRSGFDQQTGQPVMYRNRHTMFWVPMQFLGPLAGLVGLILLIKVLVS